MSLNGFISGDEKKYPEKIIYRILNLFKLNELLQRADRNIIGKHITSELYKNNIKGIISESQLYLNKKEHVDIYIRFLKYGKEYAHISLHLTGMDFDKRKYGPFNLKIFNYKYNEPTRIQLEGSLNTDKFKFMYSKYNKRHFNTTDEYLSNHPEFIIGLNIINKYLSNDNNYSLEYNISKNKSNPHPYYKIVKNRFKLFFPETIHSINPAATRKAIKYKYRPLKTLTKKNRTHRIIKKNSKIKYNKTISNKIYSNSIKTMKESRKMLPSSYNNLNKLLVTNIISANNGSNL